MGTVASGDHRLRRPPLGSGASPTILKIDRFGWLSWPSGWEVDSTLLLAGDVLGPDATAPWRCCPAACARTGRPSSSRPCRRSCSSTAAGRWCSTGSRTTTRPASPTTSRSMRSPCWCSATPAPRLSGHAGGRQPPPAAEAAGAGDHRHGARLRRAHERHRPGAAGPASRVQRRDPGRCKACRRATSAIGRPVVQTSSTASRLNASVNRRRVRCLCSSPMRTSSHRRCPASGGGPPLSPDPLYVLPSGTGTQPA